MNHSNQISRATFTSAPNFASVSLWEPVDVTETAVQVAGLRGRGPFVAEFRPELGLVIERRHRAVVNLREKFAAFDFPDRGDTDIFVGDLGIGLSHGAHSSGVQLRDAFGE